MKQQEIGAIILAAGKGKRMGATDRNKVVFPLQGKPMILYTLDLLKRLSIDNIVVVVGFAKESVIETLGNQVVYAYQENQYGTADAVRIGLQHLTGGITQVIVLNGDDSALYKKETIERLIEHHLSSGAQATFLTTKQTNPEGTGRIVRTNDGKLVKIVEEKDASDFEKHITEINVGCYVFQVSFLKLYIPRLGKSSVTGEYYLTGLIDLALKDQLILETVMDPDLIWNGVNTKEELERAEKLLL